MANRSRTLIVLAKKSALLDVTNKPCGYVSLAVGRRTPYGEFRVDDNFRVESVKPALRILLLFNV